MRLHCVQQRMHADKRKRLADSRYKNYIADLVRFVLHFFDEDRIFCDILQISQKFFRAVFFLKSGNFFGDSLSVANGKKHAVKIIFDNPPGKFFVGCQFFREVANSHFVFRVVAKNSDINLARQAFALQKLGTFYQFAQSVQTLSQSFHEKSSSLSQAVERRQKFFLPCLADCFF